MALPLDPLAAGLGLLALQYIGLPAYSTGNRSNCLKVISPETRVMLPKIHSHVARYVEYCRPKFHIAQKDSNVSIKSTSPQLLPALE